jgi:hypothetical protein
MLQRTRPSSFIEPCLPYAAERPPSGPDWVHEIKHDGYRLMARRDPVGIRLLTRNGYDWAPRYPAILEALNLLKVRSCLLDGEAVACDDNGLTVFELLRGRPRRIGAEIQGAGVQGLKLHHRANIIHVRPASLPPAEQAGRRQFELDRGHQQRWKLRTLRGHSIPDAGHGI